MQTAPSDKEAVCTIIICTLALAERAVSIDRAIASVLEQNDTPVSVLLVVNGDRYNPQLLAALQRRADIEVLQISARSLSEAIAAGRRAVKTPYFGFLDDDDEYLPRAVDLRCAELEKFPEAGVLVTNGYRRSADLDKDVMRHIDLVTEDPLIAIFREPWLASCSGLYRTVMVPQGIFDNVARYAEWTWLGFVIASAAITVRTLDVPTFRINDTPNSESKSDQYLKAQIAIFERMMSAASRVEIHQILKRRIRDAWHSRADASLARGQLLDAWRCHLRSLAAREGWRYLPFTRHLIPGWPRKS